MNDSAVLSPSKGATKVPAGATKCKKVIAVAPKGGVGKSTLIMNLFVSAQRAGLRAIGVDFDGQETLSWWSRVRDPKYTPVHVIQRHIDDYQSVLKEVTDYDIAFFDTPPGHSSNPSAIEGLSRGCDLIIVPTSASVLDLVQVIKFNGTVLRNKGVFVLNKVSRNTSRYQEARKKLTLAGTLCPVDVPQYEDIGIAASLGLAAADLPATKGKTDLECVWEYTRRQVTI